MFKINIMRKGEWEMKKKMNNKGFSLVELIIVIAIMVILVAVLAPQYLKYVEKSRVSTDTQTTVEFINLMQTVAADPDIKLTDGTEYKVSSAADEETIKASSALVTVLTTNGFMTADSFDANGVSTSRYQSTAYRGAPITLTLKYDWVDGSDHAKGKIWSVTYSGVDNSGSIVTPAGP